MNAFLSKLQSLLSAERVITDELRRLAYGTDASFYRLLPEVVVVVNTETEVQQVLALCREHGQPVTFRAAGTSLSGQAITDSVLVLLGDGWKKHEILDDGLKIRLGPAIVGVITGSVVIESVFGLPGVGSSFIEGAVTRDYTRVMGAVILYGGLIIVLNLIADILYAILDPKVRFE